MTAYSEFRIRIEPGTRKGSYRVEASGVAGNQTGVFKVPFRGDALENFVLKVGQTRRGVRSLESPQFDLAKSFGGKLFSAVMHGPVGELYRASFSSAQAAGNGTRVTLSLTDVPELAEIPWEYLFDAPNFLAISTSTPVVRYLAVPKPARPLEVGLPIRILGVVSAPSDFELLDADAEKERLTSALKPLIDANAVSIEWLEVATLPALTKKLQPDTFHILHFIGHGGFDRTSGKGALLFEDDTGRGRPISGEQLATVLNNKTSLRLVFLNSCEGARVSLKDPFSGVAASLIEREIPAVIAMQFEITDRAAIIFGGEFYANLAEGQPVDAAVTQARLLVFADDNDVEWGTPVLFLRVQDGRLFDVAGASTLPRVAEGALPPKTAPPAVEATQPAPDAADGERSGAVIGGATAVGLMGAAAAGGGGGAGGAPSTSSGSGTPPGPSTEPQGGIMSNGTGSGGTPPGGTGGNGTPPGGTGGGGSGGSGDDPGDEPRVIKVGPIAVHPGRNLESAGIGAIAVVAILAVLFMLGGLGSTGGGSTSPPPSEAGALTSASADAALSPIPTPSASAVTPPPATPPPATPAPTPPAVKPMHIAIEVNDRTTSNSGGIIEGVKLALKDAGGAVDGVPVTVPDSLIFDDKGKASSGQDIIAKLIKDEDVVAMVGPYNSTVVAAQMPASNKAGLLQCSPSATSEGLTRPEQGAETLRPSRPDAINFVRTVTTNELDPVGAAMFLIDGLGVKAVYIVDTGVASATIRSDRFQQYWESRGATVVGRESIPSGATDYSGIVTQAKAAGADVVYFSGSSGASEIAARLLKAMRDVGLAVPLMGSGEIFDGTTGRKGSFLNLAKGVENSGVYMTYPAAGDYDGRAAFEVKFASEYGHAPSLYAITGYACTEAILDALSRTDLTLERGDLRDAVRKSVVDFRITYDTAMGHFRFDEYGDTTLQIITLYTFVTGDKDWQTIGYLEVPDQ